MKHGSARVQGLLEMDERLQGSGFTDKLRLGQQFGGTLGQDAGVQASGGALL